MFAEVFGEHHRMPEVVERLVQPLFARFVQLVYQFRDVYVDALRDLSHPVPPRLGVLIISNIWDITNGT